MGAEFGRDRETIESARVRALHAYALLNAATGGSFMGEREALLLASDELLEALKLVLAARGKKVALIEAEMERPAATPVSLAQLDEGRQWIPPAPPRQGSLLPPRPQNANAGAMSRPVLPKAAAPSADLCACGAPLIGGTEFCEACFGAIDGFDVMSDAEAEAADEQEGG